MAEKDNSLRFISKSHQAGIMEGKPPPYFTGVWKVIISNKKESHNEWMKEEIDSNFLHFITGNLHQQRGRVSWVPAVTLQGIVSVSIAPSAWSQLSRNFLPLSCLGR